MYSHLRRERGWQNGGHQEDPAVLRRHLSSQSASGNREGPSAAVQPRPGGNSRGCSTGSWHSVIPAALTFSSGGDGGSRTPPGVAEQSRSCMLGTLVHGIWADRLRCTPRGIPIGFQATGTAVCCWTGLAHRHGSGAGEALGVGRAGGQRSLQSPRRTHPLPCLLRQTFVSVFSGAVVSSSVQSRAALALPCGVSALGSGVACTKGVLAVGGGGLPQQRGCR